MTRPIAAFRLAALVPATLLVCRCSGARLQPDVDDGGGAGARGAGDDATTPADAGGIWVDPDSPYLNHATTGDAGAGDSTGAGGDRVPWLVARSPVSRSPVSLATDGAYVAWFDALAPACQDIRVAGVAGGYASSTFAAPSARLGFVAMANGVVACIPGDGAGLRVGQAGLDSADLPVAAVPGEGYPSALALSPTGTTAFVMTSALASSGGAANGVYGCNLGVGAGCSLLAVFSSGSPGNLVVSGGYLFWAEGEDGVVSRLSLGDSSVTQIASGQGTVTAVAVDSTHIYWASSITGGTFAISRAPQADPSAGVQIVLPSTTGLVQAIATDGAYVYFARAYGPGGAGSGAVGAVPVTGAATPTVLYDGGAAGVVDAVAVGGGAVYWATRADGDIHGLRYP